MIASPGYYDNNYGYNYPQTQYITFPSYFTNSNYPAPVYEKTELTKRQLQRAQETLPFVQSKGDSVLVPPVILALCTAEPFPKPLVQRWATVEWRARRLAATRRHMPVRSRPGAR
jgi:hypothetical protein